MRSIRMSKGLRAYIINSTRNKAPGGVKLEVEFLIEGRGFENRKVKNKKLKIKLTMKDLELLWQVHSDGGIMLMICSAEVVAEVVESWQGFEKAEAEVNDMKLILERGLGNYFVLWKGKKVFQEECRILTFKLN